MFGRAADAPSPASPVKPAARHGADLSPQREAQVLAFVAQHHPELAELLGPLRGAHPKEYQRALRDLARVQDRLGEIRRGDGSGYETELKAWVLHSRIELLLAKLTMNDGPELREELKRLLNEQAAVRLALLQRERMKVAERLAKLDEQTAELQDQREEYVQRQFTALTKSCQKLRAKTKPGQTVERDTPNPAPRNPAGKTRP